MRKNYVTLPWVIHGKNYVIYTLGYSWDRTCVLSLQVKCPKVGTMRNLILGSSVGYPWYYFASDVKVSLYRKLANLSREEIVFHLKKNIPVVYLKSSYESLLLLLI